MKLFKTLLTFSLLMICTLTWGQNITVSGKVTDASDGSPLIGASIVVQGVGVGQITDVDGKYSISVPGDAVLVFSYIGMIPVEVHVDNRTVIDVALKTSNVLDEVVVTAMGISRQEKTLGYAATTVKSDELVKARNTDVTASLAGRVAGVQVSAASADPGAANNVIIRGFGSINGNNQPLYVVDGVPISSTTTTSQGHAIAISGIGNIPSEDIASMTILKGAAATALYGSRAANGVVVITTKTGAAGDTRNFSIEYNGGLQIRQINNMALFQNDFGQGWNGAQTYIENGSWGPALDGSLQVYGPVYNNSQLLHTYSAKLNSFESFFELGLSHNHNIAVSGTSNDRKATYYLSYSFTDDDGIMPSEADRYVRNAISTRTTFAPTDWLKFSSSVNFSTSQTDIVGSYQGVSVIDGLYEMPRDITILDMQDINNPFFQPQAYYTPYGITNPYWAIANNYNHADAKKVFGKVQIDANPIKALTLSYRFGFDYNDYDRKVGYPQINVTDDLINNDYGYGPSNMNQDGYVYAEYGRNYEMNHDFLANYNAQLKDFEINATAGFTMNERASTYMSAETDVLTFYTGFWDLSNGSTIMTPYESQSKRRLLGLFADASVGYKKFIYLNLTVRNDWSSTLPLGNNSYFYPGATLSFNFSELIPKNSILTFGKVRAAYGMTGNDASAYLVNPRYVATSTGVYYNGGISFPMNGTNSFIASSTAGSVNLKPEMTREMEFGIDLRLFNGRVGLDATYYDRTTSDQIFTLPTDPATGYSYQVTNFGDVRNRGYELLLTTTPIATRNFEWNLDINFSQNFNTVVSMPESLEGGKVAIYSFAAGTDAIYMYAVEGRPLGAYYTYLPQRTEDGQIIVGSDGLPLVGSELEDTGLDMNHKWIGGITTSFRFYGFSVSATLDARFGGTMFSRTKNLMHFTGNGIATTYNNRKPFIVPNSVVYDEVSGSYVENTVPIYPADGSYQAYFEIGETYGGMSYLVDRSYAKLRNVSISYSFPRKWVNAMKLSDLTVSVFCNNVFTWTAADNYYVDPELSTTGTDLAGMFGELYTNPSCRIWGFNLSVKF